VRKLLVALSESLPEGADVSSIGVDSNDAVNVTLHTHSAGLLIGRQGATADAIRSSLQGVVGERVVKLNIHELGRDDPPPPPVVDDELRSTLYDQLRQPVIIPVGETQILDGDRCRRLITSVECWASRVLVRYTETPSRFHRKRDLAEQPVRSPMWGWSMTDDVGTSYVVLSSGSGDGAWHDGMVRFAPATPPDATALTLVAPEGAVIAVRLRAQ
jgi:predicted RNA-binding protein YlqC (UPF0109 family)